MRRLPEGRAEGPDEVGLGDEGEPGEGRHVERLRVRAVDRVAGAQQPAVGLLDGAANGVIAAGSRGERVAGAVARVARRP